MACLRGGKVYTEISNANVNVNWNEMLFKSVVRGGSQLKELHEELHVDRAVAVGLEIPWFLNSAFMIWFGNIKLQWCNSQQKFIQILYCIKKKKD